LILGFFALIGFVFFYGAFTWGLVFYKFYNWFVLPVFTILPHITFFQAMGLMMVVSLFHNHVAQEDDKAKRNKAMLSLIIAPWVVLFVGWVVSLIIH
jgi:hypothetical protein